MNYPLFVHIIDSWEDLPDDLAGFLFTKKATFFDIIEQVSTLTQFHN